MNLAWSLTFLLLRSDPSSFKVAWSAQFEIAEETTRWRRAVSSETLKCEQEQSRCRPSHRYETGHRCGNMECVVAT